MNRREFLSGSLLAVGSTLISGVKRSEAIQPPGRGMISFTFDDGLPTLPNAVSVLSKYGIPGTAYIVTSYLGDGWHLTWDYVRSLYWSYGWEIGNHTKTHAHLLGLPDATIQDEIVGAQNVLLQHGIVTSAFAPPYGEPYDDACPGLYARMVPLLTSYGTITSSRRAWTEDTPLNDQASLNRWGINVFGVKQNTLYTKVKGYIDQAISKKAWLALVFHGIVPSGTSDNDDVTVSVLTQIVNYVYSKRSTLDAVPFTAGLNKMLACGKQTAPV
jgi:peptidoglycan/xylan/chitin deacetylase (PgdA/CDA1 family)